MKHGHGRHDLPTKNKYNILPLIVYILNIWNKDKIVRKNKLQKYFKEFSLFETINYNVKNKTPCILLIIVYKMSNVIYFKRFYVMHVSS